MSGIAKLEPNVEQIAPRIRLMLPRLTEKEQQIMNDCLALGISINRFSIQELADRHDVSPAMIVKAAQRCGFSGFREMKSALVEYARLPVVDLHEELNPSDDTQTVVEKVFKTSIKALQETLAIFDFQAINDAASALKDASDIGFWGVGGSGAMALDAYHKFLRVGIRTNYCTDSHLMAMNATLMTPQSVAVGFSHSGRTYVMVEAFRLAKAQKATTIAITNSSQSPLTKYTDILLCSVAQGSPITGEGAAARVVQLNILDALFVLVAQGSYDESIHNLDRTIKAVASLRA